MAASPNPRFAAIQAASARKPHGTRARYVSGCKCMHCRAANSNYNTERTRLRAGGDTRDIVPAKAARQHVRHLSTRGVGYKAVADAARVAPSIVLQIRSGTRKQIRQNTERQILAVDESVRGDKALVSAAPAWAKINDLLERGYTRGQIAVWLGCKNRALQLKRDMITARSAMRVERMCALLNAGKLRRA
jgi:hypothetical protein